ncbi:MAG: hypothetical protein JWP29_1961 [Rhodoferax sp.]|nr:hypothetical protein [Rhodoferax sp.]
MPASIPAATPTDCVGRVEHGLARYGKVSPEVSAIPAACETIWMVRNRHLADEVSVTLMEQRHDINRKNESSECQPPTIIPTNLNYAARVDCRFDIHSSTSASRHATTCRPIL